jgi:hypothetical protein
LYLVINWWPYALIHHLNPYLCRMVWAPGGFNTAWSTSMPAAGLLTTPVTLMFGPVVTYNLLCLLAPALSATAAFLLCWTLTGSFPAALTGGYAFGFSTYFIAQMEHLPLILVFPVPLLLLVAIERYCQRIGRMKFIVCISLLIALQYLLMKEVVATSALIGGLALILSVGLAPVMDRKRLIGVGLEICAAFGVAAILVSPDLYYSFAYGFPHGEIWPVGKYSTDLVNYVIPTPLSQVGIAHCFRNISFKFTGDGAENAGYIGVPFLLLLFFFACENRRKWQAQVLVISCIISCILSMGPHLHVAGRSIWLLPWAALGRVPLLNKALPDRLMMYVFLALAIAVSLWLRSPRQRAGRWLLALGGIVLTIPNLTPALWSSPLNTPAFFRKANYRHYLSPGDTVLVLPFANLGYQMLWQVEADMYFKMADGWTGPIPQEVSRWPVTYTLSTGEPIWDLKEQFAAFVAAHEVDAIIVAGPREGPWPASADWAQIVSCLGIEPIGTGGVLLYRIPSSLLAAYRGIEFRALRRRAYLAPFSALAAAAHHYCENHYPIREISPAEVQRRHLIQLPGGPLPPAPPDIHWWRQFWLGPWKNDLIGIGIEGQHGDLSAIVDDYGRYAEQTFFPFPRKMSIRPAPGEQGQALLVFSCRGLSDAVRTRGKPADLTDRAPLSAGVPKPGSEGADIRHRLSGDSALADE